MHRHLPVVLLCALLAAPALRAAPSVTPPPPRVQADLAADLGGVSLRQVEIIRLMIPAARLMGELYDRQLAAGGLYPADMSAEEFAAWDEPLKTSPYTVVRRDPFGGLLAVPYHEAWPDALGATARLLARAAEITLDESFRHYLTLRARALITGDYRRADIAWVEMRDNDLDVVIGPIGVDADPHHGYKAGFGAYLLLKDWAWSARLAHFLVYLPQMQHDLPVSEAFKAETPDVDMKLHVYDLLYRSGYGVAGSHTTARGNGERIQMRQGARRLQLRNVMRARFDAMLRPIADELLVEEQRGRVGFEPFFTNTVLHELAHSLGLRETVNRRGPVRQALGERAEVIEDCKAAVLSLWMVAWLQVRGELSDAALLDHYASFLAATFRSIHFDADSDLGRGRMAVFNYLRDREAFRRDAASGRYRVDEQAMSAAIEALAAQLLTLQGSGDDEGAVEFIEALGFSGAELRGDLARLDQAGVPREIEFRQGEDLLGL